jgi:hypothetical protein
MAEPAKKRRLETVIQDAVPGVGLDALPRAVLLEVLSFCVLVDTARFRTVTKKTLAIPAWKVPSLNMKELQKSPLPLLQTLSLFATHTEELYCDSIAWENATPWTEVLQRMPRLAHVTFYAWYGNEVPREEDLMHIVRHRPMVDLDITYSRFQLTYLTSILRASHLTRLALAGSLSIIEVRSQVATTFVSALPNTLTELSLQIPMALSGKVIQTLLAQCPHLTRLKLQLNGRCDTPAVPDDWSWLYTPPRRWHEITLQSKNNYDPHPCLSPAALPHFARAKVQHTLRIEDLHQPTWTKELWKDFVGQPIRVLAYGLPPDVRFNDTPVADALGTLMDTFPFLETIPDCKSLYAESKSLIRAYKDRWPLIETCRHFPPVTPSIHLIHDRDVKEVIDFLTTGVADDRFSEIRIRKATTPHAKQWLPHLESLVRSQRKLIKFSLDHDNLDLSEQVFMHLASLDSLETIWIKAVDRLDVSTRGLLTVLERGTFKGLCVYTEKGTPVTLHVSVNDLLRMWRHRKRWFVRLPGVVVHGIDAADWERVMMSKEWDPGNDDFQFTCLVPSANAPRNSAPQHANVKWFLEPGKSSEFVQLTWQSV